MDDRCKEPASSLLISQIEAADKVTMALQSSDVSL